MFASLVYTAADSTAAEREAIVTARGSTSWRQLAELDRRLESELATLAGRRVALRVAPEAISFAAFAALDRLRVDIFLFDAQLDAAEATRLAAELRLAAIVGPASTRGTVSSDAQSLTVEDLPDEAPGTGESTVTILTSGTTGRPKAARHTWESLARPVRAAERATPPRWLLSYRPQLYAGLQVTLQSVVNRGTLVVPGAGAAADTTAELMRSARVEFASATPSYWRRLLLFAPRDILRQIPLEQITLGGEAIDQQILDALGQCFPQARLVHIYATTELGRCFSVTDGRAGFPARFLNRASADGIELRIDNDELLVRSANAMRGYDALATDAPQTGDWFATGDLVEIVDDRVHFVGRRSDIINVGGNKVHPLEVEKVIRQVPGVSDVRVYAKTSSIAGQLVACEFVVSPGADAPQVREAVVARCVAELGEHQRPRLIQLVDQIRLADSGKKIRRNVP